MCFEEKTMKSDKIYEGKILNLRIDTVELPDKKYSKREIIEHSDSVAILSYTEDDEILMIEQYRKALEKNVLELPSGKIELGEEPKETAYREFLEETGYKAAEMKYLLEFYTSPGFTDEKIYLFMASNIFKKSNKIGIDNEELRLLKIKREDALDMIERGDIVDLKTIVGILYTNKIRDVLHEI